jgi:tetrahydromethanopterin S-methyltransferase subunit H
MFSLSRKQQVCQIGSLTVGGQFGERPPLLIASMFQKGDRILDNRKNGRFDQNLAEEYVKRQEALAAQTGIPALVALVANSADEMALYIDWFTSISDQPFGIDMWRQDKRLEAAEYAAGKGLQDRLLYNSITPWDQDIGGQVRRLKELGIRHVVVQAFDEADPSPQGRLTCFRRLEEALAEGNFASVLVDTSVMNLPATAFSGIANRIVKEATGRPCGLASSNGTYMWKEARQLFGAEGFAAMNASGQACSALLWSDFIFYGPIVAAPRIFPALVPAVVMAATLRYSETGQLPAGAGHPLHQYFADFVQKLNLAQAGS